MPVFINEFQYCGQDCFNNHLFVKKDNVTKIETYLASQLAVKEYKMPYFFNLKNEQFYKLKLQNNLKTYKLVKGKHYEITYKTRKWNFRESDQSGYCLDIMKIKAVLLHPDNQQSYDNEDNLKKSPHIVDPDDVEFLFVDT